MRLTTGKKYGAGVIGAAAAGSLVAASMMAAHGAAAPSAAPEPSNVTRANLEALNNSGVEGNAHVVVDGRRVDIQLDARRLLKNMPHAQHIHFGKAARNECPTVRDDDNADHRINTAEGVPAYGPVRVSLTKKGDTSVDSTLAVDRYPTAPKGKINYNRDDVQVSKRVARAIRHGNAVIVIHGIDYNGNGEYDFSAGESELDGSLPAEATDPVTCGVLKPVAAQDGGVPPIPLKVGGERTHAHQH